MSGRINKCVCRVRHVVREAMIRHAGQLVRYKARINMVRRRQRMLAHYYNNDNNCHWPPFRRNRVCSFALLQIWQERIQNVYFASCSAKRWSLSSGRRDTVVMNERQPTARTRMFCCAHFPRIYVIYDHNIIWTIEEFPKYVQRQYMNIIIYINSSTSWCAVISLEYFYNEKNWNTRADVDFREKIIIIINIILILIGDWHGIRVHTHTLFDSLIPWSASAISLWFV